MPIIDLTNQRFTRLIVLRQHSARYAGGMMWVCRCDCGEKVITTSNKLRTGHTQSCGCLRLEALARNRLKIDNVRHGHTRRGKETSVYKRWTAMIQRCTNPNYAGGKSWKNYGGRGITVCKRWLNSFQNFLDDMGEPPPETSLDRKNNDKGYYKRNCQWATKAQQVANQRSHGPQRKG